MENITLNEVTQAEEDKHRMFSLTEDPSFALNLKLCIFCLVCL